MAHYRIERTLPSGWRMRLEMVTWDGTFSATPTVLGEVVLTEVGTLKAEFDSLPYGLMNPMSFGFKLVWSLLPAAMQNELEQGAGSYGGYDCRNTWYLYTDRGTAGATWTCEFAGVEDNIEALELEALPKGMYGYNVEAVDIVYFYLKTRTGTDLAGVTPTLSPAQRSCWQVFYDTTSVPQRWRQQEFEFWSINASGRFALLYQVLDNFRLTSPPFVAFSHASGSGFDSTQQLKTLFKHAVVWYRPSSYTTTPRNGTVIDADLLFVLAQIVSNTDNSVIGGMLSSTDEFGLAVAGTSLYDILRSLCEQSGVRVGYRFQVTGSGPTTQVNAIFDVKLITQARDYAKTVATPDATLDLDTALAYSNITVRGDNILKAETRYSTTSDKDATQIVKIQEGARASRSFNFEPMLINMPVDVQDNNNQQEWQRFKAPIRQTNQLYVNPAVFGGGTAYTFVKAHERTKVVWGAGASEYVEVTPTGYVTPTVALDYPRNSTTQADYLLQLNDAQVNGGIGAAITSLMLDVFANEKNAILETEWCISTNNKVLTDYICGKYTLTGNITTEFTMLNWTRAVVTSMEVDFIKDTVKHKYMLIK